MIFILVFIYTYDIHLGIYYLSIYIPMIFILGFIIYLYTYDIHLGIYYYYIYILYQSYYINILYNLLLVHLTEIYSVDFRRYTNTTIM